MRNTNRVEAPGGAGGGASCVPDPTTVGTASPAVAPASPALDSSLSIRNASPSTLHSSLAPCFAARVFNKPLCLFERNLPTRRHRRPSSLRNTWPPAGGVVATVAVPAETLRSSARAAVHSRNSTSSGISGSRVETCTATLFPRCRTTSPCSPAKSTSSNQMVEFGSTWMRSARIPSPVSTTSNSTSEPGTTSPSMTSATRKNASASL
mmetsp:Transcript_4699/g.13932  ORF Transcript_4699/g.13932 Transcript_4699/m.13932 type:complete len:208 (-) Transcript_4699:473-1096(-)